MPAQTSYPGVYIEELPSGVRTIVGVGTSITAFVGYTARGRDNTATRIFGFADFERAFGGLASDSVLSYAVSHFYGNGGGEAVIVRVPKHDAVAAAVTLHDGTGVGNKKALTLTAASKGAWANQVLVDVDYDGVPSTDAKAFSLTLTDVGTGTVERFANVTLDSTKSNNVVAVVNDPASGSQLVTVAIPDATAGRPMATGTIGGDINFSNLKNDQDYKIRVQPDVPAATDVAVTVIAQGDVLPSSVLGLAAMVERKINLALGAAVPGAAVKVTPAGKGLRIVPSFSPDLLPNALDAQITVAAGSPNALGMLSMTNALLVSSNVGHYRLGKGRAVAAQSDAVVGADGTQLPTTADLIGSPAAFTGIYALEKVDLFNLLSIPDATRPSAGAPTTLDSTVSPNDVYSAAYTYCEKRRAMLVVDPPPSVNQLDAAVDWISAGLTVKGPNAVAYFPRIRVGDPLDDFKPRAFGPSGAMAGLFARIDSERGVWKAPAGTDAAVRGVAQLEYKLSDAENGVLNPLGLNCLRTLPVYGNVCWGSRTLDGADVAASQWKYLPVRRLALMIEESLYRGTRWAVFEPNDEGLWNQLRLNITSFMHGLFRQGAFQGSKPADAYLVKCDHQTTTQDDIDRGVVNVLVGFAPLKPAEFVIIQIQQLAGESPA